MRCPTVLRLALYAQMRRRYQATSRCCSRRPVVLFSETVDSHCRRVDLTLGSDALGAVEEEKEEGCEVQNLDLF